MYKILVMDLDGTLLNSDKKISENNKKEIKRLQNSGVLITIATGRNLANTIDYVDELKIDVPVICSDGSILYDPVKKEIIHELVLDDDFSKKVIFEGAKDLDFIETASANKYIMYIEKSAHRKYGVNVLSDKTREVGIFSFIKNVDLVDEKNELFVAGEKIHSLMFGGKRKNLDKISETFSNDFLIRKNIIKGHYILSHKELGKWNAIQKLAKLLKLSNDSIVSIGDDNNDIDMLEHSALSIAMGNANNKVKKHADFVTLTNDDDGVAFASKKFFK